MKTILHVLLKYSLALPSLAWPDPFLAQGVIACSISARTKKGSGRVHSVHSH